MIVDAERTRRDVRRRRGIELASTGGGMRERMRRALERDEADVDVEGVSTTMGERTGKRARGGGVRTFRWVTSAWEDEEAPRGYVETLEWINDALAETLARARARRDDDDDDGEGGGKEDEGGREGEGVGVGKMAASPVKGTSIGRWLSDRRERVRLAAAAASEDEDEETRKRDA